MSIPQHQATDAGEHVFRAWDKALGARDLDASMELYQPDATPESPLIRFLLGTDEGIIRGRENLRRFVAEVFAKEQLQCQRFRTGFLSDGTRVTWEYPRQADGAEQMGIAEVMEIREGLIQNHRVYRGWSSIKLCEKLQRSGRFG